MVSERGVETVGYEQDGRERARAVDKVVEPTEVIRLNDWRKRTEPSEAASESLPQDKSADEPFRSRQPPD